MTKQTTIVVIGSLRANRGWCRWTSLLSAVLVLPFLVWLLAHLQINQSTDSTGGSIVSEEMVLNGDLTLLLLNMSCSILANSVDPDQLASEEANWSGSALFVIKYVNFYQKPGSSNLIGWKLEVGVAS